MFSILVQGKIELPAGNERTDQTAGLVEKGQAPLVIENKPAFLFLYYLKSDFMDGVKISTIKPVHTAVGRTATNGTGRLTVVEPKFKAGEIVYERVRPSQKLIIKNHSGLIYYCLPEEHPHHKELVFFERELMSNPNPVVG
jgi:hypothetical protein